MIFTKILSTYSTLCFSFLLLNLTVSGQSAWVDQDKVCSASLRGLSVVDDNVIWASGSNGTWLRTSDGGDTWMTGTVPGASALDLRDIHALNSSHAWVISAGDTCRIYYTANGGWSWEVQYENFQTGIFFDGFTFFNDHSAIAYSDPIEGKFYLIRTVNGKTWERIDSQGMPDALEGEAGFAASGTGICTWGDSTVWIASGGGAKARVMRSINSGSSWSVYPTPLMSKEGAGIFSMVFTSQLDGIVVGGSYLDSTNANQNCAVTNDGGLTWKLIAEQQPMGYRSCVAATSNGKLLLTVGRTGSELSHDGGNTWKVISKEGYYACGTSKKYGWAVGRSGKVGRLTL